MPDDPNKEVEEELERGGEKIEVETEWVLGFVIALLIGIAILLHFA